MSSSDAVFIIVSVSIVFAFTGVMIWWMRRRMRIMNDLVQSFRDAGVEDAKKNDDKT